MQEPASGKTRISKKVIGFQLAAERRRIEPPEKNTGKQAVGEAHGRANDRDDGDPEQRDVDELAHQAQRIKLVGPPTAGPG